MITYKNISLSAKTFYGVRFEPGEMKSVPGYINSLGMIRIFEPKNILTSTSEPISSKRGRKKLTEPVKVEVAETEVKITENTSSEEETSDGN